MRGSNRHAPSRWRAHRSGWSRAGSWPGRMHHRLVADLPSVVVAARWPPWVGSGRFRGRAAPAPDRTSRCGRSRHVAALRGNDAARHPEAAWGLRNNPSSVGRFAARAVPADTSPACVGSRSPRTRLPQGTSAPATGLLDQCPIGRAAGRAAGRIGEADTRSGSALCNTLRRAAPPPLWRSGRPVM
jgi:hypothetical protein